MPPLTPHQCSSLTVGVRDAKHRTELIEATNEWLAASDRHHIIDANHPWYPPLLPTIADPPQLLFATGNAALLCQPCIAIVGSRHASIAGKKIAFRFAQQLAERGLTVVSGMALGIDKEAHLGALTAGATIGVLGTGVDVVYPKQHQQLFADVTNNGCLISEYPLGLPPRPFHFPKRNRIITGMAVALLVVEAATKSGSLVSARLALEQGREVCAVPGSIHNPSTQGCHQLIRDGANLVTSVDDILATIEPVFASHAMHLQEQVQISTPEPRADLSTVQQTLLTHIPYDPTSFDAIATQASLSTVELNQQLMELELMGLIAQNAGKYQRL